MTKNATELAIGEAVYNRWIDDIHHIANVMASCLLEGQAFVVDQLLTDDELYVYNNVTPLIHDEALHLLEYWQSEEYNKQIIVTDDDLPF